LCRQQSNHLHPAFNFPEDLQRARGVAALTAMLFFVEDA
jgi:hypothetical protein